MYIVWQKYIPKIIAVFSVFVRDFIAKCYQHIYSSYAHTTVLSKLY